MPNTDIIITLEEIKEFFSSLTEYKCPVCGGTHFTIQAIGDRPVVRETMHVDFISDGQTGAMIQPAEKPLPGYFIQSICNQCGHINAHNYFVLHDKIVRLRNKKEAK